MADYLVRLDGGPLDDLTFVSHGPWPLPDRFYGTDLVTKEAPPSVLSRFVTGEYVKVAESQLKEDHPGVARGATYEWRDRGDER